jgi:AcrR family transcriptional regulator
MSDEPSQFKAERLELLYAASLRLFARFGFARTRVEDVARELGMTKGNLYFYVRSKEELYFRTVDWALGAWCAEIEASIFGAADRGAADRGAADAGRPSGAASDHGARGTAGGEGAAARFGRMARGAFGYMREHPDLRAVIEADPTIYSLDPHEDRFAEVNSRARNVMRRLIVEGQASGEFRSDLDLEATADFLYAVYIAFLIKAWSLREGEEAARLFEAGIDIAIKGLLAPEGARSRDHSPTSHRPRRHP